MMFERFAPEARTAVVHAQEHARRLGHTSIGCEHLLLAVASTDQPASTVLREHGVTPERVEREIVRQVGLGADSRLFGTLNRDALASIGIDLDTVRSRIEESFGPDALLRADRAAHRAIRRSRPNARRRLRVPKGLLPHWRRRRAARAAFLAASRTAPTGLYQVAGPRPSGHLPLTPRAKESLAHTVQQARSMRAERIGVEHLALGLMAMNSGLMRTVLSELGASATSLRAAIIERCRPAT
jgi:ATP-dependent Clp protease ATP-binding subunit ClpA